MLLHLHVGHRRVEYREGRVADFCPVCREIQPFNFFRVSKVMHVSGVTVDSGEVLGHFVRCASCSFQSYIQPERYAAIHPRDNSPLETLIEVTFPTIRAACAERLEWEGLIRQ